MQKKIIVILSAIIIIVSIIIIASNIEIKTYIEIDGNKYYAILDGKPTSTFPEGNYTVDVDCTNAKGYWDSINKKVIVKNITGSVSCDIAFTKISDSDYLADYIINLQSTSPTQGASAADGTLVKGDGGENDIRYEGKNPYNYVLFNNELWRIIGVFDENSHGVSNTNLVKLIRADSIGGLAWDKSNTNDWVNSSLNALLNGAYYKATTDTTNCYGYSTTTTATCDYTSSGIQSGYRNMIQKVTWYLGGGGATGYTTYTPASIYGYERNSSAIYSGRSTSTTGYIGLMYESDYLYGVLSSCARTTTHDSYNTAACSGSNWLNGKGYEWTITPSSNYSNYVWSNSFYGRVCTNNASYGLVIRPVLYLKSNIYRISGTGTISDPYIIGEYYDPNAPKYWNGDFSGTTYTVGSTPTTTYSSVAELASNYKYFSTFPYYIKTTSIEHVVCFLSGGVELCVGNNYITNNTGSAQASYEKLQSFLSNTLESGFSCSYSDDTGIANCKITKYDISSINMSNESLSKSTVLFLANADPSTDYLRILAYPTYICIDAANDGCYIMSDGSAFCSYAAC